MKYKGDVVMKWIVSVLVVLLLAAPASAQLRFIPLCDTVSAGFQGECFPEEYIRQKEFTVFLFHIVKAIGSRCAFGVKDPELPATRNNLVLLSCPELSLSDLARP